MSDAMPPAPNPTWMVWTGRVLSALPVLMLTISGVIKLMKSEEVVKGMADLGYPEQVTIPLGIVELACTAIYVIPQTAVLGAILLTGYMGGTIATHVRLGEPFMVQALIGVVIWLGLYLRDRRLRELLPLRSL